MTVPLSEHVAHVLRPPPLPTRPDWHQSPRAAVTIHVPVDLEDRIRNAAHALAQSGAGVMVEALIRQVEALEAQHNDGQPFPARPKLTERLLAQGTIYPARNAK